MSSIEYNIEFNRCCLKSLARTSEHEYEGKLTFQSSTLEAEIVTKPQTREWWIETAERVGGEFEKQVKIFL